MGLRDWFFAAAAADAAGGEKVVLVTSILLCEMPPLRLPGMPPLCCFFWLLTMVSMEWLRTRMALSEQALLWAGGKKIDMVSLSLYHCMSGRDMSY